MKINAVHADQLPDHIQGSLFEFQRDMQSVVRGTYEHWLLIHESDMPPQAIKQMLGSCLLQEFILMFVTSYPPEMDQEAKKKLHEVVDIMWGNVILDVRTLLAQRQ